MMIMMAIIAPRRSIPQAEWMGRSHNIDESRELGTDGIYNGFITFLLTIFL
jgi:hypothetical protein